MVEVTEESIALLSGQSMSVAVRGVGCGESRVLWKILKVERDRTRKSRELSPVRRLVLFSSSADIRRIGHQQFTRESHRPRKSSLRDATRVRVRINKGPAIDDLR